MMLNEPQRFNQRRIRSYTSYECRLDDGAIEREISFHVHLSCQHPRGFPRDLDDERQGDNYPVYEVPEGRMVWLSDWSFNAGSWWCLDRSVAVGGSLGRIIRDGAYVYVLNCAVRGGEMEIYSPARPIRYLPGEWIAFCFHHLGEALNVQMRATLRFTEVDAPDPLPSTHLRHWGAEKEEDDFPGPDAL
jgi:hypothetical protein